MDLGLVDKTVPGQLYLCLPEEDSAGNARLRFEVTAGLPGDRMLAIATEAGATPATLYLVDVPTGNILVAKDDVLGLETGLDMNTGSGPATPGPLPGFPRPTGVDRDGDPTLVWATLPAGIREARRGTPAPSIKVTHTNPFGAPGWIEYTLRSAGHVSVEIVDVAGRVVSRLYEGPQKPGDHRVFWDTTSNNGARVASGVYFVRVRAAGAEGVRKLVVVR